MTGDAIRERMQTLQAQLYQAQAKEREAEEAHIDAMRRVAAFEGALQDCAYWLGQTEDASDEPDAPDPLASLEPLDSEMEA